MNLSSYNCLSAKGPCSLRGFINLQGSKNSALSLIPTLLLGEGTSNLRGVPDLIDIHNMLDFIKSLGIEVVFSGNNLKLSPGSKISAVDPHNQRILSKTRTTFYFIPYFLKHHGRTELAYPGGCSLGARKSDYLFEALKLFGASVLQENNKIVVHAKNLRPAEYRLPYPSHSASTILLSLVAICNGTSVLENVSLNPEIDDKLLLLKKMGVSIESPKERTIVVHGDSSLTATEHDVIPDRVAAATWIAAAGITGGCIEISSEGELYLNTELGIFEQLGLKREQAGKGTFRYFFEGRPNRVAITTGAYPEFSTDIQPLAMVLVIARGASGSEIREKVFDKRFQYVGYLNKMGCDIEIRELKGELCPNGRFAQLAVFRSAPDELIPQSMIASDLRAGMALTLAALRANGTSHIDHAYQIFRGYERVDEAFRSLGAEVRLHQSHK